MDSGIIDPTGQSQPNENRKRDRFENGAVDQSAGTMWQPSPS